MFFAMDLPNDDRLPVSRQRELTDAEELQEMKAQRDLVRAMVLGELRRMEGLPEALVALLLADERATKAFADVARKLLNPSSNPSEEK